MTLLSIFTNFTLHQAFLTLNELFKNLSQLLPAFLFSTNVYISKNTVSNYPPMWYRHPKTQVGSDRLDYYLSAEWLA